MGSSYDVRREMLVDSSAGGFWAEFWGPIPWYRDDPSIDTIDHTALLPDCEASDRGPYAAWCTVNPVGGVGNHRKDAWHRTRAYVLWDWGRIQEHGLLETFHAVQDGRRPEITDAEAEEWRESWNERYEIEDEGGSGYWVKGDLSRVEYL